MILIHQAVYILALSQFVMAESYGAVFRYQRLALWGYRLCNMLGDGIISFHLSLCWSASSYRVKTIASLLFKTTSSLLLGLSP